MANVYHHSRRKSKAIALPLPIELPPPPAPWWRRLFSPPDSLQVDAGATGELLVAKIRVLVTTLFLTIPLVNLSVSNDSQETLIGLGVTLTLSLTAIALYLLIKQDFYRPWVGFLTSAMDVTLVSGALSIFFLIGLPHTAVNSKVTFEGYFLAIGATSLRYDLRICAFAGLLAVLEYGAIILYGSSHWALNDPSFAPYTYGMFDWSTQISRLILLTAAAFLSGTIVVQTQSLRRLSRSDRLTGLPNRAYFDERVMAEMSRARRYGHPISLAMIDVDHFKRFNDSHGHAAGDVALKIVANAIRKAIRETDLVVRYGGEEFVAVLPGMDAAGAVDRMETVRRAIAQTPVPLLRTGGITELTISAGVAVFGVDGVEVEDLLDRADVRLFQAKEAGRNRIVGPPAELLHAQPTWRMSGGAPPPA